MTPINFLWNLLFASLGAFIGAFLAIFRENKAKPNLIIEPGSFGDSDYPEIAKPSRFIHLKVFNKPWPNWWRRFFYGLRPALNCKARLDFIDPLTNATIFSIQGRWSSMAEPGIPIGDRKIIFDPSRAIAAEIENILPHDEKEISVALKVDGESDFVAFNNWSYQWPNWRNPAWVIDKKSVYLKVALWWNSGKTEKCFVISNEQKTIKSFHLEEYSDKKC